MCKIPTQNFFTDVFGLPLTSEQMAGPRTGTQGFGALLLALVN